MTCLSIRPYQKCSLMSWKLTDEFFDLPVETLTDLGCFTDDMNSVCGDFGLCERTKPYAVRSDIQ